MQRTIVVFLLLSLATGCGAGGRNALFSTNTTRVPPPSTKSYGTADNGYYNGNAPKGLSNSLDPAGQAATINSTAANNSPGQGGDLKWRSPGSRNSTPAFSVTPVSAQIPSVPGTANRVAAADYAAPLRQYQPGTTSNESPISVVEGGAIGSGVAPRVLPATNSTPISSNASAIDPNDIANLPRVSNMPRIRVPNNGTPTNQAVPPTMSTQPPATPTTSSLNWRTQS